MERIPGRGNIPAHEGEKRFLIRNGRRPHGDATHLREEMTSPSQRVHSLLSRSTGEKTVNANTLTLEVAADGTVTVPVDLVRALGFLPRQTITVKARKESLVLMPSRKERLNRIGQLLRAALVGVEWTEIEAGRRDRWF